jgi:hypothetical protein
MVQGIKEKRFPMQNKLKNKKAGVSLITVLLFMMIATIAATATYKWITSEGRSSASRMLEREAYQSSLAGIENARAWMTYHANDVGGLVTQYFQNDKKPILLDSVLKPFNNQKQTYNVWLTGVSTEGNTYKLKLLSSGKSRNDTRHTEVAILNVTGLYQVRVPQTKDSSSIDFEYAYFGGGFKSTQVTITSAIVNGNWSGNPPNITENWVVTGNATLSGSNVKVGETACIGGNASIENNGLQGNDIYIGGDFKGAVSLTGDAYFEGDITQNSAGNFYIAGNMTLEGVFKTYQGGKSSTIEGNLCVGDNGQIYSEGTNYIFSANGSVWMPGQQPIWTGGDNHGSYNKIVLGRDGNSRIYIKAGHPWSDYDKLRNDRKFHELSDTQSGHPKKCSGDNQRCDEPEWWKGLTYQPYPKIDAKNDKYYIYYMPDGWTDVTFGRYQDNYWIWPGNGEGTRMNSYFVNYPGTPNTNGKRDFDGKYAFTDSWHTNSEGKTNNGYRYLNYNGNDPTASPYCTKATDWQPKCGVRPWFQVKGEFQSTFPAEKPEDLECAESVKADCDSIWVKGTGCDGANYKVKDPLVTAKDKFLEYATKGCANSIKRWDNSVVNKLNECYQSNMADSVKKKENLYNGYLVVNLTSADQNGTSGTLNGKFIIVQQAKINAQNGLPGTTDETSVFLYLEKGATYIQREAKNYFIFTEGDIGESSGLNLTGTIYAPTESCANANFKDSKLQHNNELIKELTDAAIICNNDGSPCGGSSADTESSLGGVDLGDFILAGKDVFYIATAPQLGVTLESQYEAREKEPAVDQTEEINPSIIVLPRVVYLTTDAVGKLPDYYSVLNLNGADEEKDPSNVSCTPSGLNTTAKLYDGTTPIAEGVFTCVYKSSKNYGTVPFYVVVSGTSGDAPSVAFETDNQELLKSSTREVKLVVPQSSRATPVSVDIMASALPNGWTVTPQSGVSIRDNSNGSSVVYTATFTPSSAGPLSIPVFSVNAGSDAENNSMLFQLMQPCDGCVIGMPFTHTIFLSGSANINRLGLTEYCSAFPDACDSDDLDAAQRPDCDVSAEWVRAVGMNCRVEEVNNRWTCGTNQAISLQSLTTPNYCELFMPSENNSHSVLEDGKDYTLYASLKKKPYTLTVKIDGANESATSVTITTDSKTETCLQTDDACDFTVYAGENVSISYSAETDKFSYWKCSGDNCPVELTTSSPFTLQPISGNNTVTAKFNDKDKHCFYEDFSELTVSCNDRETCIRDCEEASGCVVSGSATASWQFMQNEGFNKPVVSSGYINLPSKNKGVQTFIMSTKQAGANGQMTSMMQVPIVSAANKELVQNTGLVVRSNNNASSYLLLSVYGVGDGSFGTLTTRLCKGTGLTSVESCAEKQLKNNGSTIDVSQTTMVNMSLTANKDSILVEARVDGNLYKEVYDISAFNMTSQEYQYVGFKLSDEATKLYDIAWRSSDYADDCWSVPSVDCSFKANYLGGLVPKDSNVTPWVGASSWFTEHSCEYKYYYNGNDNITTTAGTVDGLGSALASKDYNFSEEGTHGPENKDAKVAVECPDNTTSLNGQNTSCGNFWVGEQSLCSQSYTILNEVIPVTNGVEREFSVTNSGANLREAVLNFKISDLADGGVITVYLKDASGNFSLPGTIKANGNQTLNVNLLSNKEGFDPQKVTAIVMEGTAAFNISFIASDCPYAFGISNCSATYDGASWQITSTMKNVEGAAENGCSVVPSDGSIDATAATDVSCPTNGTFAVSDPDLYTRVNAGVSEVDYTFTIKAQTKDGTELSCVTDKVTIKPAEFTCSVTPEQVVEGAGMPTLSFEIANCPPSGCPYTVTFESALVGEGDYTSGTSTHNYSGANTADSKLVVGTHYYKVSAMGKEKECGFEVVEAIDAEASCSVSGNTLSVTVKGANYGNAVPVKVGISDVIGNVLGFESISMNQNTTKEIDLSSYNNKLIAGTPYPVTLTLNGNGQSCGEYTPPLPELTLQCPANLTGKNASEPVTITPTVEGCNVVGGCDWTITPATEGGSGTDYTSGSMSFTNTNGSGTVKHTINITRPKDNATKSCSFDVVFIEGSGSVTADCKVIGSLYQSQSIQLEVSNISGISQNSKMKWIMNGATKEIECNASNCWANSMNAPSVPGNYDYVLTYNEKTVCAGTVEIGSALTCAVSPNELNKGEEYSFTAHRNINCWNCYYQFDNGTENNIQFGDGIYDISLTKTATNLGNKTLSLNCTCNGNIAASCSQEITINDVPPSFSCPDDLSFETNSQITITPKDLTGCESGCAYTISGTSVSTTNFEYSSGALPSFTAPSTAGNPTYTISLTNNVGTTSKDCSVEIIEPKPCVASDWIIEQNNSNKEISKTFNDGCFEINTEKMCSNAQIHASGSGEIILNGKTFSCGYHDEGITPQSIIELKVPKTCTVSKLYVSNCVDPPKAPAFSCPDNLSFEVNSSVTITPTGVTGCESGCDYEISGTSVQGNSYTGGALPSFTAPSTAGTVPYTIVLENDVGPTSKTCDVKFTEAGAGGSSISVFFNYNDEKTFESGKTYSITCALKDSSLRELVCKTLDGSSHKFTYDGAEATANPAYWGSSAKCKDGEKTLITSKNIKCKYTY